MAPSINQLKEKNNLTKPKNLVFNNKVYQEDICEENKEDSDIRKAYENVICELEELKDEMRSSDSEVERLQRAYVFYNKKIGFT